MFYKIKLCAGQVVTCMWLSRHVVMLCSYVATCSYCVLCGIMYCNVVCVPVQGGNRPGFLYGELFHRILTAENYYYTVQVSLVAVLGF